MAQPLGPQNPGPASGARPAAGAAAAALRQQKKKGCKQNKCSKWKGGKCRCGRD